jgi:ribonuclease E
MPAPAEGVALAEGLAPTEATAEGLNTEAGAERPPRGEGRRERGEGRRERGERRGERTREGAPQEDADREQAMPDAATAADAVAPGVEPITRIEAEVQLVPAGEVAEDQPAAAEESEVRRERRSRDRYGRDRKERGERGERADRGERAPLEEAEPLTTGLSTPTGEVTIEIEPRRPRYSTGFVAEEEVATEGTVAPGAAPTTTAAPVAPAAPAPAPIAATASGAPAQPAAAEAGLPKVKPYQLPTQQLLQIAEGSGLQWVNSDAEKIAAAQAAIAAEPQPVRVPRERPAPVVIDEGPLVLVETKRDLRQFQLPGDSSGAL